MEIFVKALKFVFETGYVFFLLSAITVFLHCFYDRGFLWHKKKVFWFLGVGLVDAACYVFLPSLVYLILNNYITVLATIAVLYDYKGRKIFGVLKFVPAYIAISMATASISLIGSSLILGNTFVGIEQMSTQWAEYLMTMDDPSMLEVGDQLFLLINTLSSSVSTGEFLFVVILSTLFFGLVFFYMYNKLYKRDITLRCKKQDIVFAAVYPCVCYILCCIILGIGSESSITTAILTFLSIFFGLMFPVFVYFTRVSQHYQDRAIYQENHMQAELSHFEQYKHSQEETARFRHDIRNNLLCLNNLLLEGNTQEVTAYLNDLLHISSSLSPKFVSGDEMLDCILGVKDRTMEENQIHFQLDGVLAGGLSWKPMDICNVFANALDNAIEGCLQLPEDQRAIVMSIRATEQYWFIAIENPVLEDVDVEKLFLKDGGFSSKAAPEQHGIGTYNMKRTVEAYGGVLKAVCQDHRFTLEIMIDKCSA